MIVSHYIYILGLIEYEHVEAQIEIEKKVWYIRCYQGPTFVLQAFYEGISITIFWEQNYGQMLSI